jgi:hypothetical protein
MVALVVVWMAIVAFAEPYLASGFGSGHDAHDYWLALRAADPYAAAANWGQPGVYVYSPAFFQLTAPLLALPWTVFLGVWTGIALVALAFLARPRALALMVPLALVELWGGNIHLLLAAALVLGFRWPAAWAFVLLTKVTPGIGLLWFAMRREWRSLVIALGATAVMVVASFLAAPALWREWLGVLMDRVGDNPVVFGVVPIPLILRLPVACALIVWAAPRDKRWVLPIACMLALPAWWVGGLTMLLAIPTLVDWQLPAGTVERVRTLANVLLNRPASQVERSLR